MVMQRIEFASTSNKDRSPPITSEEMVNLFADIPVGNAKAPRILRSVSGMKTWTTVGTGPITGMLSYTYEGTEKLVVASGTKFYDVDVTGTATEIPGPYALKGAPVSMSWNGFYIMAIEPTTCYIVRNWANDFTYAANSLAYSWDDAAGKLIQWLNVTFQDGYHVMSTASDDAFYITVNDGTQSAPFNKPLFDSTDFTLANTLPDNLKGVHNLNREIWAFCDTSIQIYYDSGQADFPFTRVPSGVLNIGCASRWSIAQTNGAMFWLANDYTVRTADGYTPLRISTPAIEQKIESYTQKDSAIGFAYTHEGHLFYVLTFVGQGTLVYDAATGLWHERKSQGRSDWRGRHYVYFNGKHLVADLDTSTIAELDYDTYDELGNELKRSAISPPVHSNGHRTFMREFYLDMETGVGLAAGQGSDPQIMMQYSDDGGRTWGSERWVDIGNAGQYGARARWTRLGNFRQRMFRVEISDPVRVAILDAYVDFDMGET